MGYVTKLTQFTKFFSNGVDGGTVSSMDFIASKVSPPGTLTSAAGIPGCSGGCITGGCPSDVKGSWPVV